MRIVSDSTHPVGKNIKLRAGTVSMIALSSFLFSGATAPTSCATSATPAPVAKNSEAPAIIAGVAVAGIVIGAVVLIEVHHSHHTINGCVLTGPSGLQVEDSDKKIYDLTGTTTDVKVGDQVRVHGAKEKKAKGATEQVFAVEKLNRDYGPCKMSLAQNTATPSVTNPAHP